MRQTARFKNISTIILTTLLLGSLAWASPVTSFEGGTANQTTEKFTVDGPWKLSWDFQGTALKVFILTENSSVNAKPIAQAGSGKGSMTIEKGGIFWLQVKSVGEYKLSVDKMDGANAGSLPVFEGGMERKGTSVFTAPEGWRYRFTSSGVFKATLYDANRNEVGAPGMLIGGGTGEVKVGKGGKYFFLIQATAPYKLEVLAP